MTTSSDKTHLFSGQGYALAPTKGDWASLSNPLNPLNVINYLKKKQRKTIDISAETMDPKRVGPPH